jgi:hypothetical protein
MSRSFNLKKDYLKKKLEVSFEVITFADWSVTVTCLTKTFVTARLVDTCCHRTTQVKVQTLIDILTNIQHISWLVTGFA